ncbi:hypothetical protein CVV68_21945 [Arthrobacter livingstonensis]|uniref:DUF3618 domain-containing protein n=1 Tax=Arthrobacter livingstonensis TaxID=670078 RepID=A0A2V5LDW0_9MICC|nr:DUF3618 domain-containing protein [Arthrobacter livingstonensis]PYI64450.1 hypothetical protein CVV68_21945 [Arthrobacter livingstonensis]
MSENPDTIRADIEATRARLGTNVDAVADKVTPSHIVRRQTDKVKDAVFGVKDKVMGAADHGGENLGGVDAAIGDAPAQVKTRTQGNPLAAGLIAFGAGLLVSSLIPASQQEREAADALKTAAEPLTHELTEAAKDIAEGLKEPPQEAMENIQGAPAAATEHVRAEGQDALADVQDRASEAKDIIQQA